MEVIMVALYNIEKMQNIIFPKKYIELYQSAFKNIRKTQIQADDDLIIIKKFLTAEEISEILEDFFDYFGYDIVPIIETEYEDYICLDYRKDAQNPSIVYWNYELAMEKLAEGISLLYDNIQELVAELE